MGHKSFKDRGLEIKPTIHFGEKAAHFDFFCTNPDDMYFKQLADKVRYFKEDEKGVAAMCKVMEDMRNETAERTKIEIAMDMIKDGYDKRWI